MGDFLDILGSTALYATAVRLALPILFAALGEVFAERAGLVNVGLEGMMLAGAFAGVIGAHYTGSPWLGAICGMVAAIGIAAIQAGVSINLSGDQIVVGIALNLTVLGVTSFLARAIWEGGDVPKVDGFSAFSMPVLSGIPALGPIIFKQSILIYVALIAAFVSWWVLTRTSWGLRLRSCGEDPRASDSLGISVFAYRWKAMIICGALAGLGGVFLSLGQLFTFSDNMSGGRGYIALAVVIIARWSPLRALWAAFLFGACEALALRTQVTDINVPAELMLALPYVVTLIVYAGVVGRSRPPKSLGRGYSRG
ncbi:MAG: ABC transporter permease [Solirubrobacterales bacterium]|nr:ABC transporter permease [Solirubrobacterales bacterium]